MLRFGEPAEAKFQQSHPMGLDEGTGDGWMSGSLGSLEMIPGSLGRWHTDDVLHGTGRSVRATGQATH